MKTERRFTLIEMLVVIAVIGILAAMLLPAISKAHQMGLQVQCLNNEKQIGAAMQMYVQDNRMYCLPGYNKTSTNMAGRIGPASFTSTCRIRVVWIAPPVRTGRHRRRRKVSICMTEITAGTSMGRMGREAHCTNILRIQAKDICSSTAATNV